ncbi:MAG: Trk system potassium transporter TrkA [Planctomycetota bacterium]
MRVTVLGAGEVGMQLGRALIGDGHEVSLIDSDHEAVTQARDELDIEVIEGHGGNVDVLEQAQVSECELFCAVTQNEELNILASLVAKKLGAQQTAVRIRGLSHIARRRTFYRRTLGFDLTISPEEMTAAAISRFIRGQDLIAVEGVADGRIQIERFRLTERMDAVGKKIRDIKMPRQSLVVAVLRGTSIIIPSGDDEVHEGDELMLVGTTETIERLDKIFGKRIKLPKRVMIVGGGRAGVAAAKTLERLKIKVTLLDSRLERAEKLSQTLKHTHIEHADGTNMRDLQEESVHKVDLFLSMTSDDERNLLSCQLAKIAGAQQAIALVKRNDYRDLHTKLNIDGLISPRHLIAQRILRYVSTGGTRRITPIEKGRAEIIELDLTPESPLIGIPLKEVDFPRGAIVGAVVRKETAFVPRGEDALEEGDLVIVFALTQARKSVEALA